MNNSSLLNIPKEIFHLIFDHLDTNTIFCSVSCVCKQFHAVVNSYNRFKLKYSIRNRKFNLKSVIDRISPLKIVSLTLIVNNNNENHITNCLSSFNIHQLNNLHSLTLTNFTGGQIETFLFYINVIRISHFQTFLQRLSNVKYKKLCVENHFCLHEIFPWPIQSTLQRLRIQDCDLNAYQTILRNSLNLKELEIDTCVSQYRDPFLFSSVSQLIKKPKTSIDETNGEVYPQLISLIINKCCLPCKELQKLLSLTRCLLRLRLISIETTVSSVFDGSNWEQWISNNLSLLNKFEFSFTYIDKRCDDTLNSHAFIFSFQTRFWLEEKHCFVTCDFIPNEHAVLLYTTPVIQNKLMKSKSVRFRVSSTDSSCRLILHPESRIIQKYNEENQLTVNLCSNLIGNNLLRPIIVELENYSMLHTLNLSKNQIGDVGVLYLAEVLQNRLRLVNLNLSKNRITDIGIQYLCDSLKLNTTITSLDLSYNLIEKSGAQQLYDLYKDHQIRVKVFLHSNKSTFCDTVQMAIAIRNNNENLFISDLHRNIYGDEDMKLLAEVLQHNEKIKRLNFSTNKIGDVGIKYLCECLRTNRTIVELDISNNSFGNVGMKYLSDVLRINQTLTKLIINHIYDETNQINDIGVQYLIDALQDNTGLRFLQFHSNQSGYGAIVEVIIQLRNDKSFINLNLSKRRINDETIEFLA
ncbi:unnamed protein product, partial [Adineta ricciae]